LNRDLGFSDADRIENIRRIGEVARLFADAGLVVLCAAISPFARERTMVREWVGPDRFLEVYVDTPLDVCIARDPKGLYAKALRGEIRRFTGIDSPYEPPNAPDLHLQTAGRSVDELADDVVRFLQMKDLVRTRADWPPP
jgi:bifunctional enzyme CysN/CysC